MQFKAIVSNYLPETTCDLSGKTGEAIEVSFEDGTIVNAVVCFAEFQKLVRFRHKQAAKANGGASGKISGAGDTGAGTEQRQE